MVDVTTGFNGQSALGGRYVHVVMESSAVYGGMNAVDINIISFMPLLGPYQSYCS